MCSFIKNREVVIERIAIATKVNLEIKLDGKGEGSIYTEIGFLDLSINTEGDI